MTRGAGNDGAHATPSGGTAHDEGAQESRRPHFRYAAFAEEAGSTHRLIVEFVPEGARVLEFGCATGYMSKVLKEERSCSVVGIELDPDAADVAREHCDRILVGDAEMLDFEAALGGERFDVILFADVLEHLRNPGEVLERVRPLLAEHGRLVASVPNVAHASVRLALLGGEFRYRETGLLDSTHLRFFTRSSLQDLFETSGFAITRWCRRRLDVGESEIPVPFAVPDVVSTWLAADPEATTYQFVVAALPSEAAPLLAAATVERDELRKRVEALEAREAELETLGGKDDEIGRLQDMLRQRDSDVVALGLRVTEYERMRETRSWRVIRRWWAFKAALRFWR